MLAFVGAAESGDRRGMMIETIASTRGVVLRLALIAASATALAGCDTLSSLSSLNPFDSSEKYEMKVTADIPPERMYDQGLGRLKNSDHEGAAKKFDIEISDD